MSLRMGAGPVEPDTSPLTRGILHWDSSPSLLKAVRQKHSQWATKVGSGFRGMSPWPISAKCSLSADERKAEVGLNVANRKNMNFHKTQVFTEVNILFLVFCVTTWCTATLRRDTVPIS
jgi:hypothetical protein